MKTILSIITLTFLLMSPVLADDYDELYGRWYAGDWVSSSEDLDGRRVWYGLRIEKGNEVHGCILYPNKDGIDRKLFGQIIDTGANDLEIRLSNGREIELKNMGREPKNKLKFVRKHNRSRTEIEFVRDFLPSTCV